MIEPTVRPATGWFNWRTRRTVGSIFFFFPLSICAAYSRYLRPLERRPGGSPLPKTLQSPVAGHSVVPPVAAPPKSKKFKTERNLWWKCGSVVLRLCHFPTALKVEEFSEMGAKKLYRGGRRTKLS